MTGAVRLLFPVKSCRSSGVEMVKLNLVRALSVYGCVPLLLGSSMIGTAASGAEATTVQACTINNPPDNCQNLWALQIDLAVEPSVDSEAKDPGCAAETNEDVLRVLRASRVTRIPSLQEYSGSLAPAAAALLDEPLRSRGIDVTMMLSPFRKDGVTCATVAAVTPWPTIYMGFRLLAADDQRAGDFQECEVGTECPIGRAAFPVEPIIQRNRTINVIHAPFVNWSPQSGRKARLIVFYKMRVASQKPRPTLTSETHADRDRGGQRHMPLEGASNFRDLGGYITEDGRRVRWGLLYRSDALDGLTQADQQTLEDLDIVQITDFRTNREAGRRPNALPPQLAARQVRRPLDYNLVGTHAGVVPLLVPEWGGHASNEQRLNWIDKILMGVYPRFATESRDEYGAWLRGLIDGPENGAHVFHCTGGADRTGFAAAVLLLALGVPESEVMNDYLLTNQFLYSPEGREMLDKRTAIQLPDGVAVHPRYLEAALKQIEAEYGSFDAYLREGMGLDNAMLARLKARYLE